MKKSIYDILKQSFYEINEHYLKYISALALQAFLLIASFLFLPPFGFILAFLVMVITQIGLAKYSLKVLGKKQQKVQEVVEVNKFTFSHLITYIIKTFQIAFFGLFLIIPGLLKWLEFSQADFVLADNPKLSTEDALLESKKLTHNSKGRVLMLFVTHLFISTILVAFSASVVILTSIAVQMTKTFMLIWFGLMSVFLLCVIALPFYTVSRTVLYENLKTINKFNTKPSKNFMQEVAQEFMTAFKKPQKTKQTKTITNNKASSTKLSQAKQPTAKTNAASNKAITARKINTSTNSKNSTSKASKEKEM